MTAPSLSGISPLVVAVVSTLFTSIVDGIRIVAADAVTATGTTGVALAGVTSDSDVHLFCLGGDIFAVPHSVRDRPPQIRTKWTFGGSALTIAKAISLR